MFKKGIKKRYFCWSTLLLVSVAGTTVLTLSPGHADTTVEKDNETTALVQNDSSMASNNSAQNAPATQSLNVKDTSNGLNEPQTFNPTVSLISYSNAKAPDNTPYINIGDARYPRTDAVDVSSYQGSLTFQNYQEMKNNGVKTVIVKMTQGTSYINPCATSQVSNAQNAGLGVAAYHFCIFNNAAQARAEANFFANKMDSLGLSKYTPVIADMESSNVQRWGVANDLNAFWDTLSARGYLNHIVYCSLSYDQSYNVSSTVGGKNKTWVAQYLYNPSSSYLANQEYGAWQFSSHGRINGYNGDIDLSIDYGNIFQTKDIKQFFKDGKWYISVNGVLQKNSWQYLYSNTSGQYGWSYYDNNGASVSGDQYINGNWYYFDPVSWQAKQGWHFENNNWYYYSEKNDNSTGKMMNGDQFINNEWYYLDPDRGGAMWTGWRSVNNQRYYYQNNGKMARGWLFLNNYWYYFNASGEMQTGWHKINDKWYHFDANGQATTGSQQILGMNYYFDPQNAWAVTGWLFRNGRWYYYDDTNAWALTGWQKINSRWYYFDQNGKAFTGSHAIKGMNYYFDPTNAWAVTGWSFHNGSWYYYDDNNAWALTGWQKINDHWYNFDSQTGAAKTGDQLILGMHYYFDPQNDWAVSGWSCQDNKWYYYDPLNAWALSGWAHIDGQTYYFDPQTHIMQAGLCVIHGKTYYFNNQADGQFGVMKTGWQLVNGHRYFFDLQTGKMLTSD